MPHSVYSRFEVASSVQRYSQTRAQNCILEPTYEGIMGNISTLSESFNTNKLCSEFGFLGQLSWKGLRSNVCDSSIAHWKACGRLPIRDNSTLVASSYSADVISRYWSKSALFRGGWVSLSANVRWKSTSPIDLCWYQNKNDYPFM